MFGYVVGGQDDPFKQLKLNRKRPTEELQLEQFQVWTEQLRQPLKHGRHYDNLEVE